MNRASSSLSEKAIVSKDTKVETKVVPTGDNAIERITITTTKTIFSDGSTTTNTETKTVIEKTVEKRWISSRENTVSIAFPGENKAIPNVNSYREVEKSNSSSSSSDSDASDDEEEFTTFQRQALQAHNEYRSKHGAGPMKLSKKICKISQNWVNTVASRGELEHSRGTGYGENVYWGSGTIDNGKVPVDIWYSEIKNYQFGASRNGFQPNTGHFSQVVWRESTELGIAKVTGRGGTFVVANYNPPGNFQGQYHQNVTAPI